MRRERTVAPYAAPLIFGVLLLAPRPRFSWEGRLPAGCDLTASGEAGQLFAATVKGFAFRTWIYKSPYDYTKTVQDLERKFPNAKPHPSPEGLQLLIGPADGPELIVSESHGFVKVCARTEKCSPGPIPTLLSHVLPVRSPVMREYDERSGISQAFEYGSVVY